MLDGSELRRGRGHESKGSESTGQKKGGGVGVDGEKTNTGIIDEHVEALLPCRESLDGGLDGGQVRQVELQKLELAAAVGGCLLDYRDGALGLGLGASGDADGRIVGVEDLA